MKLLIAEGDAFSEDALTLLKTCADVRVGQYDRAGLIEVVSDIDVLWVKLGILIDREILDAAPSLKLIASPTTGLNHIDLTEAARRGISVLSLKGETDFLKEVRATAEHTVGLALALLRRIPFAFQHVLNGGWNRDLFKGRELSGKTVGVLGYGRLGRIVAEYFKGFDCRIVAHDPKLDNAVFEQGVEPVSLSELLAQADIVTLHVALNPETEQFFGASAFAGMKRGALLINTSRGELVEEDALLDALANGHLGGAALDVLQGEQSLSGIQDHPLLAYAGEHGNLLITPHIGGCTSESMEKTERFLAEKVCAALSSR